METEGELINLTPAFSPIIHERSPSVLETRDIKTEGDTISIFPSASISPKIPLVSPSKIETLSVNAGEEDSTSVKPIYSPRLPPRSPTYIKTLNIDTEVDTITVPVSQSSPRMSLRSSLQRSPSPRLIPPKSPTYVKTLNINTEVDIEFTPNLKRMSEVKLFLQPM